VRKFLVSAIATTVLGAAAAPAAAYTAVGDSATGDVSVEDSLALTSIYTTITLSSAWLAYLHPVSKCFRGDGSPCLSGDMANPWFKQALILPTGYQDADYSQFWSDFDTIRNLMTHAGSSWSTQHANQMLFIGYWLPGPAPGPTANFGAYVGAHPIRGYALTLSNDAVYAEVANLKASALTNLRPMGTLVIFNAIPDQDVTANAAPPSFTGRSFGVAKMTRKDLGSPYVATHEMAHASLNFLDEYVEKGLENTNIRSLDAATPLALFDGSWSSAITAIGNLIGVYDYNISEILAANGNVNIALSSSPSTVYSPISAPEWYPYEGGMFFGRGTFHAAGSNLMNGSFVMRAADDGFAYAHSSDQQHIIDDAFNGGAYRANDRLRNAGPEDGWPLSLGSTTHVMMYDGDKLDHFQGTQYYVVQVGWWERTWSTCWAAIFPYPCYTDNWRTAQKNVYPQDHAINLKSSAAYGLANLFQSVACGVGVTKIGTFDLCNQPLDTVATNFLPTFTFRMPYEETDVPASQWFTTYWWHFATWNGTTYSGWTGWSSFYRSF